MKSATGRCVGCFDEIDIRAALDGFRHLPENL